MAACPIDRPVGFLSLVGIIVYSELGDSQVQAIGNSRREARRNPPSFPHWVGRSGRPSYTTSGLRTRAAPQGCKKEAPPLVYPTLNTAKLDVVEPSGWTGAETAHTGSRGGSIGQAAIRETSYPDDPNDTHQKCPNPWEERTCRPLTSVWGSEEKQFSALAPCEGGDVMLS